MSILIDYLDFKPNNEPLAAFHSEAPEMDRYPSVYAFAIMEDAAGPPLLEALLNDHLSPVKAENALTAYMYAFGVNPMVGVQRILDYPLTVQSADQVEKRRKLAIEAAAKCRERYHQQCEAVVSDR